MIYDRAEIDFVNSLHPAYFETRFRVAESGIDWPSQFAILSAYATTGQTWSVAANQSADRQLVDRFERLSIWHKRVVGFSPQTGHAEPSWCLELAFDTACDWGLEFLQDAIYYVDDDWLSVSHCDARRKRISVGAFRQRIVFAETLGP